MMMLWHKEEKELCDLIEKLTIPSKNLEQVPCFKLKTVEDLARIGNTLGVYWILTNAPIHHYFHRRPVPEKLGPLSIIYNGFASDVRSRIKTHLFRDKENSGESALGADIICKKVEKNEISFRKKAWYPKMKRISHIKRIRKIEFTKETKITKNDLTKLSLTEKERRYIAQYDQIFFDNGINISSPKYAQYEWHVYCITGLKSKTYARFLEKKWREQCGKPQLCIW